MAKTLCIWVPTTHNGPANFEVGLGARTWGFNHDRPEYTNDIEYVLFGRNLSKGGPRQSKADWATQTMDVVLARFAGNFYTASSPLWGDEIKAGKVLYQNRFGFQFLADVRAVSAGRGGPLHSAGETLRLAALRNQGEVIDFDPAQLLTLWSKSGQVPPPVTDDEDADDSSSAIRPGRRRVSRGQGRVQDAKLRSALEQHSVEVVRRILKSEGWKVDVLGKPFDLVATRAGSPELHVEVKGTVGAGLEVLFTPNEVDHFRTCPGQPELFVVSDIRVDRSKDPYRARGGVVRRWKDYRALPQTLTATKWSAALDPTTSV